MTVTKPCMTLYQRSIHQIRNYSTYLHHGVYTVSHAHILSEYGAIPPGPGLGNGNPFCDVVRQKRGLASQNGWCATRPDPARTPTVKDVSAAVVTSRNEE